MAIQPSIRDYLEGVARRLDAAPHGGTGTIITEATSFLGWSASKLYSRLKADVGWSSGRKVRADKGSTKVDSSTLEMLGAVQRECVRANGKQILHTPDAVSILATNGFDIPVSAPQVNRLLKARRLNVASQKAAEPVQSLRSLHPNHVHQVDPSLCVLYYLPNGRQAMMEADKFYKNKLSNYTKVKFKVWRYVIYDHTSSTIYARYVEAAGESPANLFDFLMWAWGRQDGREFHGVPKILIWDKGSANTATAIKSLLEALDVTPIEHAAGRARVKGGVENGNNIFECKFESRLKLEPVETVEELNAAALAWANAFNNNMIARQDNRLHRPGMAPTARMDLWRRIRQDQLRLLPDVEICRATLEGREDLRTVNPKLHISYRHPASDRRQIYSVKGLDGICAQDKVTVRPLLFGDCAITVRIPTYDGEDKVFRLEPERGFDEFGFSDSAPVIGEEYKAMPDTAIEKAAKKMDELAYPEQDAKKSREKQATPFGGSLDAHSHLKDVALPAFLPRRGSELSMPDHLQVEAKPLNLVQAASALKTLIPDWDGEKYQLLAQLYPDGVMEADLQLVVDRLTKAPRLRVVGGA